MYLNKIYISTISYNNLPGLLRTYESICKIQINVDIDISWIVVDGASKDGTVEWLNKLKPNFEYVWLSEKDSGIYNAMNKCIDLLPDDRNYTIFMNSGDEFADGDFLKVLSQLSVTSTVVLGDAFMSPVDSDVYLVKARKASLSWLGMPTSHQAMFFRNDFIKETRYDEGFKLSGDYDLYCKSVVKSYLEHNPIVQLNAPVCIFYLDGVSVKKRINALKENYRTRRNVLNMNILFASALYVAHYSHHYLKMFFPTFMRFIRKSK